MTPDAILRSDVLDILFEHRNKQYGAYELRKFYEKRLWISVALMLSLSVVFLLGSSFKTSERVEVKPILAGPDILIQPPPIKPAAAITQPPKPKVATIRSVVPHIVKDKLATDTMPTQDDIAKAIVSTTTQVGEPQPGNDPEPPVTTSGDGAGLKEPAPEPPVEPAITSHPDFMPEFPGGEDGLRRFLSRNLRMPESGIEPGQRVRVPVTFVVDVSGKVITPRFDEHAGNVFKQEILRVINKMPAWKAGSQHGRPIAVYYTLPVIFEMGEE
jgi:periplasmic protein TonB